MADFDFGTIIYLLLIALVTIMGGRKKKKNPAGNKPAQENSPYGKDVLEEILQQIAGVPQSEEKPKPAYKKPVQDPVFAYSSPQPSKSDPFYSVENHFPIVDAVEPDYFERKQDFFESNKKTMDFDAIMEGGMMSSSIAMDKPNTQPKKRQKIDLRKAVIYSEILNRKSW